MHQKHAKRKGRPDGTAFSAQIFRLNEAFVDSELISDQQFLNCHVGVRWDADLIHTR